MGAAGEGKQWHHIVEQTGGNVERFGAEAIHSTSNLMPLETALHQRVSGFYSSIRPGVTGSSTQTVGQWLSSQPIEVQQQFGRQAVESISKGVW